MKLIIFLLTFSIAQFAFGEGGSGTNGGVALAGRLHAVAKNVARALEKVEPNELDTIGLSLTLFHNNLDITKVVIHDVDSDPQDQSDDQAILIVYEEEEIPINAVGVLKHVLHKNFEAQNLESSNEKSLTFDVIDLLEKYKFDLERLAETTRSYSVTYKKKYEYKTF